MSNDVIIITSDTNGFGDDEFDENKVKWINSKVNTLPQEGIIPSNFLPTLISSLKLRTINNHFNITERNCQIITKGPLAYYDIKKLHCKTPSAPKAFFCFQPGDIDHQDQKCEDLRLKVPI